MGSAEPKSEENMIVYDVLHKIATCYGGSIGIVYRENYQKLPPFIINSINCLVGVSSDLYIISLVRPFYVGNVGLIYCGL